MPKEVKTHGNVIYFKIQQLKELSQKGKHSDFFFNQLKYLCCFRDPECAQQKIKYHPKLLCMVLYVNQSSSEAVTQFAP